MNAFRSGPTLLLLALALAAKLSLTADPMGTAFTYKGQLTESGVEANGNFDLVFALRKTSASGTPTATVTNLNVAVSNGLCTTVLDFGGGVFDGTAYWVEIRARVSGGVAFDTLVPRQELRPLPNALFAASAPLGDHTVASAKIADGSVANADLANNAVTTAKIQDGAVGNADLGDNSVTSPKIVDGDLLTASARSGHAMEVADHTRAQGAIIGKAMTPLSGVQGLVPVLVSLR